MRYLILVTLLVGCEPGCANQEHILDLGAVVRAVAPLLRNGQTTGTSSIDASSSGLTYGSAADWMGEPESRLQEIIGDPDENPKVVTKMLILLYNAQKAFDGAIDAVRAAADAKDITLELELERDLGPVRGDRNRLQQIVWNLVSNAIKFTPSGGSVNVRLARDAQDGVITVRDTGIGIRAEFLPHIFERFRQGDSTSTRIHGGLGLGLAIVRHLVDLHGGTVAARSAGEGRGATFTVRLPLSPTGVEAGDVAWLSNLGRRAAPGLSLGGIHILVVEDEPDTRESVALSLELCGGRVTAVASAAAALEVLDRDLPDVMLCDIGMPGVDGYALIREVRARGADDGGRIPAVALTAYARDEDRSRALEAGFQTHVPKPVEPTELAAVVANLCRASEPVERLAATTRR